MESNSVSHWKKTLPVIAILALFITVMKPVSAGACDVNCLQVYSISLQDLGTYIRGVVKLTDEHGSSGAARSSVVHVEWTRADGTTLDQFATIGTRLRAEFRLYTMGATGAHTLNVVDATKQAYTFAPELSATLSDRIVIGDSEVAPDNWTAR